VPFPYNIIVGRETAVPCPLYHSDATGFDINPSPRLPAGLFHSHQKTQMMGRWGRGGWGFSLVAGMTEKLKNSSLWGFWLFSPSPPLLISPSPRLPINRE
jgi:hypothetical protein